MQPFSGNQRPDLLTSLKNISFVLRLSRDMHLSRSSSHVPRLPSFLEMLQNPHVLLTFGKVQNPLRLPRKIISEPSKLVRACGAFNNLTWKCASRHNGVHFFDMSTSKSVPSVMFIIGILSVGHITCFEQWYHRDITDNKNWICWVDELLNVPNGKPTKTGNPTKS